jgi:hypothetical protein
LISIKAEDKKLQKKIDALVFKQIPFAVSQGLSNAVQKTRDNELKHAYSGTFDKRNEQFFKLTHSVARASISHTKRTGVAIAAIKRADAPKVNGTVGGTTRRKVDTSFMEKHVTGGTRKALRTKKAIPLTQGRSPVLPIKRSPKTGKVSKAKQAKTLYPQDRTYMMGSKGGNSILMVRTGKKTVKAAYVFANSVTNTAKYNPTNMVLRGVTRRMKTETQAALVSALRTSRLMI